MKKETIEEFLARGGKVEKVKHREKPYTLQWVTQNSSLGKSAKPKHTWQNSLRKAKP